jgi:hypothetical protein
MLNKEFLFKNLKSGIKMPISAMPAYRKIYKAILKKE